LSSVFKKKKNTFWAIETTIALRLCACFFGVAGNCNVEAPTHVELDHEANGVRLHVREPAAITISGKFPRVLIPLS
jgi:hypothetical protein